MWVARLSLLAVLCGTVSGTLKNYTIDNTDGAVVYTEQPLVLCTPGTCRPSGELFNGTSTITGGSIIVSFTGTAVYAYLAVVGECIFDLDGVQAGYIPTDAEKISLAYENWGLPAGPHTLTMSPAKADQYIQFDYLVYTNTVPHKAHVGAIVGGVIGGVALTATLSLVAFFLRRRNKQRKVAARGIPLEDHWTDKSSLKLAQMNDK
ncbi:hypothetical protein FB451DRAFT_1567213 [Mycena latifolia]|nr:hypothetical protein FB451DRAFT_1567213 [Mycena latifolia]